MKEELRVSFKDMKTLCDLVKNPVQMHGEFKPEQRTIAREVWDKIGRFFWPTWEQVETGLLSEPCINEQLRIWLCCTRAWEKYFARHPQSKSEDAKGRIAKQMVAASLGAEPGKALERKMKGWDECVALYQETAREMGLPDSSPMTIAEISVADLKEKFKPGEDFPLE